MKERNYIMIATIGMMLGVASLFVRAYYEMVAYILIAVSAATVFSVAVVLYAKDKKFMEVKVFNSINSMVEHSFFISGSYTASIIDLATTSYEILTGITNQTFLFSLDNKRSIEVDIDDVTVFNQLSHNEQNIIQPFDIKSIAPGLYCTMNVIVCSTDRLYEALNIDCNTEDFSSYIVVCIKDNLSCAIYVRSKNGEINKTYKTAIDDNFFDYLGYICTLKENTEVATTYGRAMRR